MVKKNNQGAKQWLYITLTLSILLNIILITYGVVKYIRSHNYQPDNISYDGNRNWMYKLLPIDKNDNVFIGDSHIYKYNLNEFFKNPNLKNRGIDGDTSPGLYYRLDDILKYNPKAVFMKIGVNDIKSGIPADSSYVYLNKIIDKVQSHQAVKNFYVMSMFPTISADSGQINAYNEMLKRICTEKHVEFINVYPLFFINGKFNEKLKSPDGLHLSGEGYRLLSSILKPYLK